MKASIDQNHVGQWKTIIMGSSCDDHGIWKIVAWNGRRVNNKDYELMK